MAEYTRDIKQLQKTASQEPQFQAPSQSVGQDVVNLIGTGLDFYAKGKAQSALDAKAKRAEARQKKISKAAVDMKQLRDEGQDQLSKTGFVKRKEDIRTGLSDSEYLEALAIVNPLTKTTEASVMSDIDARDLAEREKIEATNLEGSAFATQVLNKDPAVIANASPEQMQTWADKSKQTQRQIEIQKQIIEVSDDVTAPIVEIARTIAFEGINSQLETIRELQRTGDVEGYTNAGTALRTNIMQMVNNAPNQIKLMMPKGKESFYDGKLVSVYTKELTGMLENATVKAVLSGKEVNEEMTNSSEIILNSYLSPYFLEVAEKVAKGDVNPQIIDDFKNITQWQSNKDISGVSMTQTMENTIYRAMGRKPLGGDNTGGDDPAKIKQQADNKSQSNIEVLFDFVNDTSRFLNGLGTPEIEAVNTQVKDYIIDKIGKDVEISEGDVRWIEDNLTFGNTGNTEKKGKGASKAVLQAPIAVLAHKDYAKIKPSIDKAIDNGVDVVGALTMSLDNHIKNNVSNAFTNLMSVATSGMMGGSKTGISKSGGRGQTATGTYNLRDKVGLHNDNGQLVFKYKAGTLGQSTDANMIGNLRRLNSALVVLNDYSKALSNVTGTEQGLVADEIRGLLGKYVNVPLEEGTTKKGIDLSTMEGREEYKKTN